MQELTHRTLAIDYMWEVQRQGLKMTVGLLEWLRGCRGGLNIFFRCAESELPATLWGDVSRSSQGCGTRLKAQDRVLRRVSEGCDCSGLTSREGGKKLSTELWGRPESGRKKKQQWRYQRRYRMKPKRGESYSMQKEQGTGSQRKENPMCETGGQQRNKS